MEIENKYLLTENELKELCDQSIGGIEGFYPSFTPYLASFSELKQAERMREENERLKAENKKLDEIIDNERRTRFRVSDDRRKLSEQNEDMSEKLEEAKVLIKETISIVQDPDIYPNFPMNFENKIMDFLSTLSENPGKGEENFNSPIQKDPIDLEDMNRFKISEGGNDTVQPEQQKAGIEQPEVITKAIEMIVDTIHGKVVTELPVKYSTRKKVVAEIESLVEYLSMLGLPQPLRSSVTMTGLPSEEEIKDKI
jgi:hypothetical protein